MTGKYKKSFIILCLLLFSACRVKTTNETSFILKEERIQISQNSSIDYLSYIEGNNESIQYTPIDTSKRGTYNVVYTQNNQQHTLIVDVVRMYEHHILIRRMLIPKSYLILMKSQHSLIRLIKYQKIIYQMI